MKNRKITFAVSSSLLIIIFLFIVNYITSSNYPWFIYPAFAVLWWPVSVYFAAKKKYRAFSLAGSLLVSIFFTIVNMISSPEYIWFIYPVFAVLWWPVSMYFGKKSKVMSIIGSSLIICFFLLVNRLTSPGYPWFIYPSFAALWWPTGVIIGKRGYKMMALTGSILLGSFIFLVNMIHTPEYFWSLHCLFLVAWWPLSAFLAKRKTIKLYSIITSAMMIIYLMTVNYMFSPSVIWYPYVVLPLLYWPVIMLAGRKAASLGFSIAGSLITILYYALLNLFLSPGHLWFLYLMLPVIWWPVSIFSFNRIRKIIFLYASITVFIIYYSLLNYFLSPVCPWSLFLLYPYAWILIGVMYGKKGKSLSLAISGTVITGIFCTLLNLFITPETIWAVYPVFALIWWPLSVYFFVTRKKQVN